MQQIDISEAKAQLPALLDAAINGAEIMIEVMATVGGFLNDNLPDRFCAGRPQFDQETLVWKTPILLSYPILGPLGQVGEITVSADAGAILSFTPIKEMRSAAQALIEQHREEIEAPLP